MYWSFALVVLVPPSLVTVTSTGPTVATGTVAEMLVLLLATNDAGLAPKFTADAVVKFVPVIVTVLPPAVGPGSGGDARHGGRRRRRRRSR